MAYPQQSKGTLHRSSVRKQCIQQDLEAASGLLQTRSGKVFSYGGIIRCRRRSFATYERSLPTHGGLDGPRPARHIPLTDLVHFTVSYFPPEAILAARKILTKQQGFGKIKKIRKDGFVLIRLS